MQNKYAEVTPRNFNPMWAPGLSEEARKAVNAAFDAMSTWRIETAKNSEKNSEQVIEKMAAAARALGWPEQVVDTIRAQMQSITKMQIQTMDQMMDAWEEQIKSPKSRRKITPACSGTHREWPQAFTKVCGIICRSRIVYEYPMAPRANWKGSLRLSPSGLMTS